MAALLVSRGNRPEFPQNSEDVGLTAQMQSLLRKCWHPCPTERPTVDEVVETWELLLREPQATIHKSLDVQHSTADTQGQSARPGEHPPAPRIYLSADAETFKKQNPGGDGSVGWLESHQQTSPSLPRFCFVFFASHRPHTALTFSLLSYEPIFYLNKLARGGRVAACADCDGEKYCHRKKEQRCLSSSSIIIEIVHTPAITNRDHLSSGTYERIMTLAEIPASPLRSTAGAGAYFLSLSQSRGCVESTNELGPNHLNRIFLHVRGLR
jgi:hypothetical protein